MNPNDNGHSNGTSSGAKRVQSMDLRVQERQPLEEVIPLDTPYLVYIEPTNACNYRCKFCPTSDPDILKQVGRPTGLMSLDLFKKIVDDLKVFPRKLKLLSLYKDGEPTLHKEFPDMIRYAKDAGIAERIWTKTNASRLAPALNQRLVDSGLDMINLSINGTDDESYKRTVDVKENYERVREGVRDLYERRGKMRIYAKIADTGLSQAELDKFYADFTPISDFIAVEKLMGWSYSDLKDWTLGTNPDTYDGLPLVDKISCPVPFYVMAVNWNGNVSLCGNDWSHNTAVGDASKESMMDIWMGDRMFEFRRMMIEGRRKENKACGECYYQKIVPDNIDAHRERILAQLIAGRAETPCQTSRPLPAALQV